MPIITDDGSKGAREAMALFIASQAKLKFGRDVDKILSLLIGQSCSSDKDEVPDFILKCHSGIVGIEHFEVDAESVMVNGKWQSPLAGASKSLYRYSNGKAQASDLANGYELMRKATEITTYFSSIQVFKDIYNKHLKKVEKYRQRIKDFGGGHLVFLVEMLSWNFVGITAVGNKSFDCGLECVPLCKDIADIIADTNDVDAIVLLFNVYPFHNSTVYAFTPEQARNSDIGVETYEYAGNSELLEKFFAKLPNAGITKDKFYSDDNYETERTAIWNGCKEAFELIKAKKPCLVNKHFYDMLAQYNIVKDNRGRK